MNIGDKVRAKYDYPNIPHGTKGYIKSVDLWRDEFTVLFENGMNAVYQIGSTEIEIISEPPKIPVPRVLIKWFKEMEQYMGMVRQ